MSFGDQILQNVTDETKLRAPLEERGRMIDVANFASKYYAALAEIRLFSMESTTGMAATFAKDDTSQKILDKPFTKCLVDISENLFANIVWPVDTAVAPELAGGVVFFSCLSATEHISGSFAAPAKTLKRSNNACDPSASVKGRLTAEVSLPHDCVCWMVEYLLLWTASLRKVPFQ